MRFLILLGLLMPAWVVAETSLWRVSHGNAELFIGGTIHVLSRRDYPLPPEFENAYGKADRLVLETDLSVMAKPEMQRQLLQRLRYGPGESLRTRLSAEAYRALAQYCADAGIPMAVLQGFKPPMAVLMLTLAELKRLGLAESGVDDFFNRRARRDGKTVTGLETPIQQVDVIVRMGAGHENELILSTIKEMQELPSVMQRLKAAWRQGDLETLKQVGIVPMRTEYPALYEDLLVRRNQTWLPEIVAMLTTPERELILVGALHLAGRDGVLAQLRRRGYTVKPY